MIDGDADAVIRVCIEAAATVASLCALERDVQLQAVADDSAEKRDARAAFIAAKHSEALRIHEGILGLMPAEKRRRAPSDTTRAKGEP